MLTDAQFVAVADAFGLGDVIAHTGPTGRGESGSVFRLTTSTGSWAGKRLIHSQLEVEAREDIEFVAAARAAGVPTPAMLTTRGRAALLDLPDTPVRVSEWVDLLDVTRHWTPRRSAPRSAPRSARCKVRDVTWAEDLSQIRTASGPQVMATLRNLAITLLRLTGAVNITAAIRHQARHHHRPNTLLLTC